jgi:CRISPR type III-A-associated RAMP protein Csm5
MKIWLRTLSPVHIGSGETLSPLEYVVYNNVYYKVRQRDFVNFLDQTGEEVKEQFADWVAERYVEMAELETESDRLRRSDRDQSRDYNQRFRDLYNSTNVLEFCRGVGKQKELLQFLNQSNVMKASVQPSRGRLRGQVRESFKTGTNKAVIPGSTLKGAIRTALFYHWLKNHASSAKVESVCRDQLKRLRSRKVHPRRLEGSFADPLEQMAFYCQSKNLSTGKLKSNDEKLDILKLLHVSDTYIKQNEAEVYVLGDVKIFLVERQQDRYDKRNASWVAGMQPQTTYAETIRPGATFSLDADLQLEFLLGIKGLIRDGGIQQKNNLQWLGLEDKVKHLFDVDIHSITKETLPGQKEKAMDFVVQAVHQFAHRQQEAEAKWLANFKKHDEKDRYTSRIAAGLTNVSDAMKKGCIRTGFATGFPGMTALLYFLEDSGRKDLFKEIMEAFKIGNDRRNRGVYKANPDKFPKSKRMVQTEDVIYPMGWMQFVKSEDALLPWKEPSIQFENEATSVEKTEPATAVFYNKTLNYRKPPILDAVVVKSGQPNEVQLYITKENMPIFPMNGYRTSLKEGTIVQVQPQITKKGIIQSVAFRKEK